jgi:hypothetical protein
MGGGLRPPGSRSGPAELPFAIKSELALELLVQA